MQRDVARGRGKILVIMTTAIALAGLTALILGCLGHLLGFRLQQLVERFFHTPAYQLVDLALDYFLAQLYNLLGHGLLSPFKNGVLQPHSTRDCKLRLLFEHYILHYPVVS